MFCERPVNFDLRKTFSQNCKPIRVWLRLVYKITEINCRSRLFAELIQAKTRYLPFLKRLSIVT